MIHLSAGLTSMPAAATAARQHEAEPTSSAQPAPSSAQPAFPTAEPATAGQAEAKAAATADAMLSEQQLLAPGRSSACFQVECTCLLSIVLMSVTVGRSIR